MGLVAQEGSLPRAPCALLLFLVGSGGQGDDGHRGPGTDSFSGLWCVSSTGGLPEMALKKLMQGDGGMVTSSGLVELLPPKVLGESRFGVQYYTSS